MYDDVIDLGFATLGYSKVDEAVYWNNAMTNQVLSDKQIQIIEKEFITLKRNPTVYFEKKDTFENLIRSLENRSYKKSFEDSWLFWENQTVPNLHFDSVKKVESKTDLRLFLDTFDRCYQKDDPQNPYGELGNYLAIAASTWEKHHATDRVEYFMVFKDGKPVSVSTLTNFEGIGYISNVGSLQIVRGQGFGKLATLYCIHESMKKQNTVHCLATEEGYYPHDFYKRLGFTQRFAAVGYTK